MNLDTITIDPDVARAKVTEYRKRQKEQFDAEDAAIARGYLEAAEGRQLIRLSETLRAGGLDDNGRPNLAVARADMPWCYLSVQRNTSEARVRFIGARDVREAGNVSAWDRVMRVTFPDLAVLNEHGERDAQTTHLWSRAYRSHVPVIPPSLRPTGRGGIHLYHVLWEVDEWAPDPEPPVDPALIRHIGGDLWAVHAVWDLTDLERAVISERV